MDNQRKTSNLILFVLSIKEGENNDIIYEHYRKPLISWHTFEEHFLYNSPIVLNLFCNFLGVCSTSVKLKCWKMTMLATNMVEDDYANHVNICNCT